MQTLRTPTAAVNSLISIELSKHAFFDCHSPQDAEVAPRTSDAKSLTRRSTFLFADPA